MSTIKRIIKEEILIMANELCDKLIKEDDFHDISSGFFEDVCPNCGEIAFQGIEECSVQCKSPSS